MEKWKLKQIKTWVLHFIQQHIKLTIVLTHFTKKIYLYFSFKVAYLKKKNANFNQRIVNRLSRRK